MHSRQPSLPARDDTMLGVCEALGQDFGFNPLFLRVAFAASVLWNPAAAIGAYLALGLLVALVRWMFPDPRPALSAEAEAEEAAAPAAAAEPESAEADPLPVAA